LAQRRSRRSPLRALLVAVLALALLYFAAWPTPVTPESWSAPPAVRRDGLYAPNGKLAAVEWLARDVGVGPESLVFDAAGDLYTGYLDGRVVRMRPDGTNARTVAVTGGRPLGVAFGARGALYVADRDRGLLRIDDGKVELLAAGQGGRRFGFTDDLDVATDGTVYFSDSSWKFSFGNYPLDVIEHGPNGRLLALRPGATEPDLLAGDLHFPNGVQLQPDGNAVLFAETTNYRVMRHWLAGPKKGQTEVFAEELPGFLDNITLSPDKKRYWVAVAAPRDPIVDALSGWPRLRKTLARLPEQLRPKEKRHAQVVALDLEGKPIAYYDYEGPDAYSPISCVREHGGFLYLGSYLREGIGRWRLP
jgi:sugar lactone lactonase YvrE